MSSLEELEQAIERNENEKRQAIVALLLWPSEVLISLLRTRAVPPKEE